MGLNDYFIYVYKSVWRNFFSQKNAAKNVWRGLCKSLASNYLKPVIMTSQYCVNDVIIVCAIQWLQYNYFCYLIGVILDFVLLSWLFNLREGVHWKFKLSFEILCIIYKKTLKPGKHLKCNICSITGQFVFNKKNLFM